MVAIPGGNALALPSCFHPPSSSIRRVPAAFLFVPLTLATRQSRRAFSGGDGHVKPRRHVRGCLRGCQRGGRQAGRRFRPHRRLLRLLVRPRHRVAVPALGHVQVREGRGEKGLAGKGREEGKGGGRWHAAWQREAKVCAVAAFFESGRRRWHASSKEQSVCCNSFFESSAPAGARNSTSPAARAPPSLSLVLSIFHLHL